MWFAVNLQCLRKLYSGTIYPGKQRNIYKHIYRFYFPNFLQNPPVQWNNGIRQHFWNLIKYSGPTGTPDLGNIFTETNKTHLQKSTILDPLREKHSQTLYWKHRPVKNDSKIYKKDTSTRFWSGSLAWNLKYDGKLK